MMNDLNQIHNLLKGATSPNTLPEVNRMLEGMKSHAIDMKSGEIAQQIFVTAQNMQNNPKALPEGLKNMMASERDKELKKIKETAKELVDRIPKKTPPPKIKAEQSKT